MIDIAWLAGILEGEGCFQFTKSNSPVIILKMNDEDIVNKVSKLFNKSYYEDNNPVRGGYNKIYRTQINGTKAIEWMFTIYSLLGNRRKEKIREIIEQWKKSESKYISRDKFLCGHLKTYDNILIDRIYKRCRTCHTIQQRKQYEMRRLKTKTQ